MADHIRSRPARRVLVFTADRGIAAAALLSAISGGPEMLLPDSLSSRSFQRLSAEEDFDGILAGEGDLPPEKTDAPGISTAASIDAAASNDPGVPWVKIFGPAIPGHIDLASSAGADPGVRPSAAPLKAGHPGGPDRVIVRFFTGGSTGRPRQWPKTLRNVLGEAGFQGKFHGIGPADRILATVPPYHIYGFLFSVALPLVSGAGVAAATPGFPREIRDRLAGEGATVLVSVPAHYRAVGAGEKLESLPLRMAISSAGRLETEDEAAFFRISGIPVTEIFGSTETGGIAWRRTSGGIPELRPFPVIKWKTDAEERLLVRSPFLAPDTPRDPEGFFRAGDRVRLLPQGGLEFLGRADGVIKVGGERVDLEEVRRAVLSVDGVRDACILSLPDPGGRENRIGALVAAIHDPGLDSTAASEMNPGRIKAALSDRLPAAALPRLIRICDLLPLTPSGKIDRNAAAALFTPSGFRNDS